MMINPIQAVTSRAMWKTLGLVVVMIMVLVVFGGLIYGCVFIENSVGARVELASIRQGSAGESAHAAGAAGDQRGHARDGAKVPGGAGR